MQRELPVCLTRTQGLQFCQPQETGYLYVGPADVLSAIWKSLPSELLLIGGGGGVGVTEWAWEVKEGLRSLFNWFFCYSCTQHIFLAVPGSEATVTMTALMLLIPAPAHPAPASQSSAHSHS